MVDGRIRVTVPPKARKRRPTRVTGCPTATKLKSHELSKRSCPTSTLLREAPREAYGCLLQAFSAWRIHGPETLPSRYGEDPRRQSKTHAGVTIDRPINAAGNRLRPCANRKRVHHYARVFLAPRFRIASINQKHLNARFRERVRQQRSPCLPLRQQHPRGTPDPARLHLARESIPVRELNFCFV